MSVTCPADSFTRRPVQPMELGAEELAGLWRQYRKTRDEDLRHKLVAHYMPVVHRHARRLGRKLPDIVDFGDLIGSGHLGLLIAIDRYDPERVASFTTFSAAHICGAMIDEIRTQDYLTRGRRRKLKQFEEAVERFTQENNRPPTQQEAADAYGGPLPVAPHMLHFDTGGDDRHVGVPEPVDQAAPTPARQLYRNLVVEAMCVGLSERERLILLLHICEDLSMAEIGKVLGISESRVSQVRKNTLERLRDRFGNNGQRLAA